MGATLLREPFVGHHHHLHAGAVARLDAIRRILEHQTVFRLGLIAKTAGGHQKDIWRRLAILHFAVRGAAHAMMEQIEELAMMCALQLDHLGAGAGGQGKGHLVRVQMT